MQSPTRACGSESDGESNKDEEESDKEYEESDDDGGEMSDEQEDNDFPLAQQLGKLDV
jgi:hypothetical protein